MTLVPVAVAATLDAHTLLVVPPDVELLPIRTVSGLLCVAAGVAAMRAKRTTYSTWYDDPRSCGEAKEEWIVLSA